VAIPVLIFFLTFGITAEARVTASPNPMDSRAARLNRTARKISAVIRSSSALVSGKLDPQAADTASSPKSARPVARLFGVSGGVFTALILPDRRYSFHRSPANPGAPPAR
jgi:hypothetical protein